MAGVVRKRRFRMKFGMDVQREDVDWLWKGYIPRGKLTLMTGDPQAGKTTLLCELMAALSTGRPLPGETGTREPEVTWLMSSEDDAETTLIWRLENQGCDKHKVMITDEKVTLNTPAIQEMEELIQQHKVAMVIIDTLTTWMGGDLDINRTNESMDFMNQLKEVAQRTNCAFVLVRHRRKSGPNDNKLHAGLGSIGFTASVRSELSCTVRANGLRVLERTKGNIGAPPPTLGYYIDPHPDERNPHGVLRWSHDEIAALTPRPASTTPKALSLCVNWLRGELTPGPQPADKMHEHARRLSFSESTLRRACMGLVVKERGPTGDWIWSLAPETHAQ